MAVAILSLAALTGGLTEILPTQFAVLAGAAPLAGWFGAAQWAFVGGLWLPLVGPVSALAAASIGVLLFRYWVVDRDGRLVRSAFRHYLPPRWLKYWRPVRALAARGGSTTSARYCKGRSIRRLRAKGRPTRVKRVHKSDGEWRQQLTPLQFQVTRKESTERAFTGEYFNLHDKGLYRCICCNNALFSSDTKFESGTGWPSFGAPIAKENVRDTNDDSLGMSRTAVSCAECDAHLGHALTTGQSLLICVIV